MSGGDAPLLLLSSVGAQRSADIVGKTISGAGLRGIPGLFLLSVQRADGAVIDAHDHSASILAGDTLMFAADLKSITLLSRFPGLELGEQPQVEKLGVNILDRVFLEAVVAPASVLVGRTVREVDFRRTYGAVVVAVHRSGERIAGKVGELRLAAGDMLLLSATSSWAEENADNEAFVLVTEVPDSSPHKTRKMVRPLLFISLLSLVINLASCSAPEARTECRWRFAGVGRREFH